MTTIIDLEYALKALGFVNVTPERYNSDLTNDYTIEYRKEDIKQHQTFMVSIDDKNIKITLVKGPTIVTHTVKVRVFKQIVEYPIYWVTRILRRLVKKVK